MRYAKLNWIRKTGVSYIKHRKLLCKPKAPCGVQLFFSSCSVSIYCSNSAVSVGSGARQFCWQSEPPSTLTLLSFINPPKEFLFWAKFVFGASGKTSRAKLLFSVDDFILICFMAIKKGPKSQDNRVYRFLFFPCTEPFPTVLWNCWFCSGEMFCQP